MKIAHVLSHWGLTESVIQPIEQGLINSTWRIDAAEGVYVLQRLNPIFPPAIHENIMAVHRHLLRHDFEVAPLIQTRTGNSHVIEDRECFRLWPYYESVCYDKVPNEQVAYNGAQLVARFHQHMLSFKGKLKVLREPTHVPSRHVEALRSALISHKEHRLIDDVRTAGESVFAQLASIDIEGELQEIVAHGDLKISNILFDKHDRALTLIDWDTLAVMPWLYEMGDAMRSWCNVAHEDDMPQFSQSIFTAAMAGYQNAWPDNPWPWHQLHMGTRLITLELASRFLRDALCEDYFSWDASRFSGHGEHSLKRGQSMLALATQIVRPT